MTLDAVGTRRGRAETKYPVGPFIIAEVQLLDQKYGDDPLADHESDLYRGEFVTGFVGKWDELIDWDARADSEGQFFNDALGPTASTAFLTSPRAPASIPSA